MPLEMSVTEYHLELFTVLANFPNLDADAAQLFDKAKFLFVSTVKQSIEPPVKFRL